MSLKTFFSLSCLVILSVPAHADWTRFRGPNGTGISDSIVPTEFGQDKNLKWKLELPGRGLSSPIVVGDRVFVTCYSGYGMGDGAGELEDLKRHLVCVDCKSGKKLWTKTVQAKMPEDPYRPPGVSTHGYASNTPVSDGKHVFAFFGKSGVYAYDLEGNKIWNQSVGAEPSNKGFGSAASPIVTDKHVIVNAADESSSLVWLDKATGEVFHKAEAGGLSECWTTPILAESDGKNELVISVIGEVWALNAASGKLAWYANGVNARNAQVSILAGKDGVVYATGEDAYAIKAGGKDDVSQSNTLWKGSVRARYATPVLVDGHLFSVNSSVIECINAENGESVSKKRLTSSGSSQSQPAGDDQRGGGRGFGGGRGGFGGFGGRGGRGGGDDYASPVVADGKIYVTTNTGIVYVVEAGPDLNVIATNDMSSDNSGFGATPAISDGQLFLRSHSHLYCVAE